MELERIKTNLSLRSHDIFDPANQMSVSIIGAGSIGSNLCMLLARLGIEDITVYDFDIVEDHNLGHQAYRVKDIGNKKVLALKEIIEEATGTIIKTSEMEVNGFDIKTDILVLAVDSMEYRKMIYQNASYMNCIDCRMGGEEIQVYSFSCLDKDQYKKTLFTDEESSPLPCGGKAIGYVSYIATGLMENTIKKMMQGETYPLEQMFCTKTLTYYSTKI